VRPFGVGIGIGIGIGSGSDVDTDTDPDTDPDEKGRLFPSKHDGNEMRVKAETRGILLMVGGSFCFSLMEICSKLALRSTGVWEVVFFRGLITTLFLLGLIRLWHGAGERHSGLPPAVRHGIRKLLGPPPREGSSESATGGGGWLRTWGRRLRGRSWWMLILRGVSGSLALVCYMYAIGHLKLADAVILNKTSPVFVIVLAALFLRERITPAHLAVLAAGFVGVYNIVKPDLHLQTGAGVIGLLSGICTAFSYLLIKKLTATDSPLTIVFYFTLISMLVPVPFLAVTFRAPDLGAAIWLLGVGLAATAAQILMTLAYRLAPAGKVSIANYANALFAVMWGMLLFGEVQDGRSILGSVLILASCFSLPFLRSGKALKN
jgi:drug/metabolite transporter (DMT)-like permease